VIQQGLQNLVDACNRVMPKLDCIANNISNSHTAGYKAERLRFTLEPNLSGAVEATSPPQVVINFDQGMLESTGNELDMALDGEGFFAIQTKNGIAYTRKGNFTLNHNNELVMQNGDHLLGESGIITITGTDIVVSKNGEISVDGSIVGKTKIVKFDNPNQLIKTGGCLFVDNGNAGLTNQNEANVQYGYLELSNVQGITEMLEMVNAQRIIEIYQKNIQNITEQDKLATSRVGKVG